MTVLSEKEFNDLVPREFKNASLAQGGMQKSSYKEILSWLKELEHMLILLGCPGCGKTFTSVACLNWLFSKKQYLDLEFVKARDLFQHLKHLYSSHLSDKDSVDRLKRCHILVLDDLGATKNSEWEGEVILDILDARWGSYAPTIISTNFTIPELGDKLDGRIVSRMLDSRNLKVENWEEDRRSI